MDSRTVCREFMAGRSTPKSKNLYVSEKGVLYSYGEHFPLAVKLSDGSVAYNHDRYSSTTSKHLSFLRGCSGEDKGYGTDTMRRLARIVEQGGCPGVVDHPVEHKTLAEVEGNVKTILKDRGLRWTPKMAEAWESLRKLIDIHIVAKEIKRC